MQFLVLTPIIYLYIAATIDVKRNVYDLCVNAVDSQIALVENQGMYHSIQESVVRVYDVGRRRDDEDDQVMHFFVSFISVILIVYLTFLFTGRGR